MSVDRSQGIVNIRGKDYQTVAYRVARFRAAHPIEQGWGIHTSILLDGDVVRMRAEIRSPDGLLVAAGHAEEVRGQGNINRTAALENCETGAIGRALAAAGWGGEHFASADEMEKAARQDAQPAPQQQRMKQRTKARQKPAPAPQQPTEHPSWSKEGQQFHALLAVQMSKQSRSHVDLEEIDRFRAWKGKESVRTLDTDARLGFLGWLDKPAGRRELDRWFEDPAEGPNDDRWAGVDGRLGD